MSIGFLKKYEKLFVISFMGRYNLYESYLAHRLGEFCMVPSRKAESSTTTVLSIRVDAEQSRLASAISALRGETLAEVVRRSLAAYVKENASLLTQAADTITTQEGQK
jgi:hypothetical protein